LSEQPCNLCPQCDAAVKETRFDRWTPALLVVTVVLVLSDLLVSLLIRGHQFNLGAASGALIGWVCWFVFGERRLRRCRQCGKVRVTRS
jgi:hypothetical protein